MVELRPLPLDGPIELRPARFFDERGFFSEVWRDEWLADAGVNVRFVQDNHSYSNRRGVLRGLHYQLAPAAQDKLVRVGRGSIFDVAVDIRANSPTFGQWAGVTLSSELWNQLFIPSGFAHGFGALEDNTEVLYKASSVYSPAHERSIRFDDPEIGIDWPIDGSELLVSPKDAAAPLLSAQDLA
jgi:dTDP-4-dehydrorhamnose 3,5-epimerase